MIEIFRTDVVKKSEAKNAVSDLLALYPTGKITFDLEDCDKILRVECDHLNAVKVISLMQASGFRCEILS